MDKPTDLSEEIAHFIEAFANTEMNNSSEPKSFNTDFEEQGIPCKMILVGNQSQKGQAVNAQVEGWEEVWTGKMPHYTLPIFSI